MYIHKCLLLVAYNILNIIRLWSLWAKHVKSIQSAILSLITTCNTCKFVKKKDLASGNIFKSFKTLLHALIEVSKFRTLSSPYLCNSRITRPTGAARAKVRFSVSAHFFMPPTAIVDLPNSFITGLIVIIYIVRHKTAPRSLRFALGRCGHDLFGDDCISCATLF